MPSDELMGALLRTLVASKPNANILELGTGVGLSLSWIVDGLNQGSKVTSIDNNPALVKMALKFFKEDRRVKIVCDEGSQWIKNNADKKFDLIFADAWPGKYSELKEILDLVAPGGFYVIDDMVRQSNWPDGHDKIAKKLIGKLETRDDFFIIKMTWSTGIIIMTKKTDV